MNFYQPNLNKAFIYSIREDTFVEPFTPLTPSQYQLFRWKYAHPVKYVSQRIRCNDGVHGGNSPKVD